MLTTVLPLGSFAEMPALERHAEMPVLVFDHPTLGQCSAYPIGCSHEWLLLVSSPHRLQEYQAPETVLPLGSFAEMPALERHAELPVLVFDHPTLGQCSAYPIGSSHEWLLLVSSPHRLQEYQAQASPNPGTPAPRQLLYILPEFAACGTRHLVGLARRYHTQQ